MAQVCQGLTTGRPLANWYGNWRIPKLYKLAEEAKWEEIPERVKRYPREARFRLSQLPNDSVLHRVVGVRMEWYYSDVGSRNAISTNDPESATMLLAAVHAIILAHPSSIATPNAYGQTPLHFACSGTQSKARLAVAQLLVQHSPHVAVRTEHNHGRTPLMLLILDNPWIIVEDQNKKNRKESLSRRRLVQAGRDLCESLVQADCMAWERPSHSGETALSMALSYCSSDSSLKLATDWLYPLLQRHDQAWK